VDSGVDAYTRKRIEDEAFRCGIAMMLPEKMFRADVRGRTMSEKLIRELATRYDASIEITARRYVMLCPGACAMLVCEPVMSKAVLTQEKDRKPQLRIRYSVTSHNLRKFFQAGTVLSEDSSAYLPFLTGASFA